jgi:MoxR-like ATPase
MADTIDAGTPEAGNYEVIRNRLTGCGDRLFTAAEALNTRRAATFGSVGLSLLGHERLRTENNCVPADLVQVGGTLLLGYNVYLGLKRQLLVDDVFSLQTFDRTPEGFAFHAVTDERKLDFLKDRTFVAEFAELYQFYKDARLIQLRVTETKLLAVFQTGATARDVKVLRWALDPGGRVTYVDNRGERDHTFPASHDFEWTRATRADHVEGRHPHVNILDLVFVETVGGDLTVKVENNTQDGRGIYSEPVEDSAQSLDDADIQYCRRGSLVLLRIKPFRETTYRHFIYNSNTQTVVRADAIGLSCVSLPEDHGLLFPGGYYLRTGEFKTFEVERDEMELARTIAAPNGEDVLYVFFRRRDGLYVLYPYNLIRKEIATPLHAHGWSLFDDGTMIVLRATEEPTRVHPAQIWKTPFVSAEHHQAQPNDGTALSRVGNKDLVRGISDALTLVRLIRSQKPTRGEFEELVAACTRFVDAYYWASEPELGDLRSLVEEARRTAELVIDEFVKVQTLQAEAARKLKEAETVQTKLLTDVRPEYFRKVDEYLVAMTGLRAQRGHLITMREVRYIDVARLDALEAQVVERFDLVGRKTVEFLLGDQAFLPLQKDLDELLGLIEATGKAHELAPHAEKLDSLAQGIGVLAEVVAGLEVEDPTVKTRILDGISEVVSHTNRVRALLDGRRRTLRGTEGRAEFGAQFKLFGQAVASSLAMCGTPEATDEQLSRTLLQLEELEARFGDLDEFLPKLTEKREEVVLAFEAKKQGLLEERQKRVSSLLQAAERILEGVGRRARTFKTEDELASWFAADPMVEKLRKISAQLLELGDTVKGDELASKLKSARQDALRSLRDKLDLFDGGDLVRLGKHRFTVNTRPLDLTLVPHGETLALHLTGTDFTEAIEDEGLLLGKPYWNQALVSEDDAVYRSEYLAHEILLAADAGRAGLTFQALEEAVLVEGGLLQLVRAFAQERYDEGYDRGIHDADAALILEKLVGLRRVADLLSFPSAARSAATTFWAFSPSVPREAWTARARALVRLRAALGPSRELDRLYSTLAQAIREFHAGSGFDPEGQWASSAELAGRYLVEVLARDPVRFVFSRHAALLRDGLLSWLDDHGGQMSFEEALRPLGESYGERFLVKKAWLETFAASKVAEERFAALAPLAGEAAALMLCERLVGADVAGSSGRAELTGLLGQHPRIQGGQMELRLDEFLSRLEHFVRVKVPGFRAYRQLRTDIAERERRRLRVDEYKPKVMTAFVRNQLVDQVYLPLVGDNMAKQMGAAGEGKRTDLMGLLLLVSPPGYGKTTLMEYVASRLGLTFVKVNGPALGHDVKSLDPSEAPNATARQEVEKVGLALEMGNNVMLYIDDIQHCHPEFLQKFISLCDAQRKIEGVWRGRTRTYDLRGKKFCVVMAGNPYTESGDKFRIPDMLANRADTYNLGDVLSGREEQFSMSFLENAMTSNATLAPLSARPATEFHALVRMARGEPVSPEEIGADTVSRNEVLAVLKHLLACQAVLLKVNAEYIRSAAMEDAYRTEPRFQLQGSYRNMNKLAEKVVPVMNEAEIQALVSDHYQGESQTLTTGAESNLLKLAQLRGTATPAQQARWDEIVSEFRRRQMMGGSDDPATKITGVLSGMLQELGSLSGKLDGSRTSEAIARLEARLAELASSTGPGLQPIARALDRLAEQGGDAQTLEALGGIAQALQSDRTAPLVDAIRTLGTSTNGHSESAQIVAGLSEMLSELKAIRTALLQTALQRTGPPQPIPAEVIWDPRDTGPVPLEPMPAPPGQVDPDAVTTPPPPKRTRGPRPPEDEIGRARQLLLSQARAALAGEPSGIEPNGNTTLAAALSVIEQLTVEMATAARAHLPPDNHEIFVDDLKRSVATAVTGLARR